MEAGIASLLAEVLLESHEKLIPNFLGGGVGVGVDVVGFGAGGGPHGTEGRAPDNPWDRWGNLGGDLVRSFSFGVVVEVDLIELLSVAPSSCTSSSEAAEARWAVNKGDLVGTSSV